MSPSNLSTSSQHSVDSSVTSAESKSKKSSSDRRRSRSRRFSFGREPRVTPPRAQHPISTSMSSHSDHGSTMGSDAFETMSTSSTATTNTANAGGTGGSWRKTDATATTQGTLDGEYDVDEVGFMSDDGYDSSQRRNAKPLLSRAISSLRLSERNSSRRLVEYFAVVSAREAYKPSKKSRRSSEACPKKKKHPEDDEEKKQTDEDGKHATDEDSGPEEDNCADKGAQEGQEESVINSTFHPVITARYPTVDHEDNPLNSMLIHFCHPNCRTTTPSATKVVEEDDDVALSDGTGAKEILVPRMDYVMPKIHHFVLTNSAGRKMFGTCLTIYEPYDSKGGQVKGNHQSTNKDEQDKADKSTDKSGSAEKSSGKGDKTSGAPCTPPSRRRGEGTADGNAEGETIVRYEDHGVGEAVGSPVMYPRIEVTMSGGEEEKARKGLFHGADGAGIFPTPPLSKKNRYYYLPRCLCILSCWPYLTAFREYLTQLYRLYYAAGMENVMVAPLERYIVNLCCEIAAPPPGVFEIQTKIFNSTVRFWSPPANQPIAWVALPFSHMFSCLSVDHVLVVWHALVLERQVLLVSSQLSLLTVVAETLMSLLFPMTWTNLFVPVVPRFLTGMLDAPMPYLCGLSRENYLYATSRMDVSAECIVVDLDNNKVMFGEETPMLPPIPHKRKAKLLKNMYINAARVFREVRCLSVEDDLHNPAVRRAAEDAWAEHLKNFDEAFNLAFTPDSPNLLNESGAENSNTSSKQSAWDAVQESFLRFYVTLLRDYRRYLIHPTRNGGVRSEGGERGFRTRAFIDASRPEYQPFLEELCATQQFDAFLTKRLYDPGEGDVTFFDQSIDAKMNRSKLKLKKVETPFLQAAQAHKTLKTIIAVGPNTDGLPANWTHDIWAGAEESDDEDDEEQDEVTKMIQRRASLAGTMSGSSRRTRLRSQANMKWPEKLDIKLLSHPRPLPPIVEAEFERQGQISERLRSKFVQLSESLYVDSDPSPEVGTFTVFFMTFTAVIGRELVNLLEKMDRDSVISSTSSMAFLRDLPDRDDKSCDGSTSPSISSCGEGTAETAPVETGSIAPPRRVLRSMSSSSIDAFESNGTSQLEEAQEIAQAQLDLSFNVLQMMRERKIHADLDAYKCLIRACGRCGDATRAMQLVISVREAGLAADNLMYSCLMNAFSVRSNAVGGRPVQPWSTGVDGSIDWNKLRKRTKGGAKGAPKVKTAVNYSPLPDFFVGEKGAKNAKELELMRQQMDDKSVSSVSEGKTFMSDLYTAASSLVDHGKQNKYRKTYRSSMVTDAVLKQVTLGESLLEFLYPDLSVDTQSETCPQCFKEVSEDEIVQGWKACDSQDYTTTCPHCTRHFVARFTVKSSSPTFVGSEGEGTPLRCEYLSPWVLRKEMRNLLAGRKGIQMVLDPDFRSGMDINSTLWWNLIVSFMRYRLPITFLLQGSFQNRLIAPTPDS